MPKPKNVKEVGFVLISTGPRKHEVYRVRTERYAQDDEVYDAYGLLLKTTYYCVPASALPEREYNALILFHQARVERELAELEAEVAKHKPPPKSCNQYKAWRGPLPDGRSWDSLILVNCCHCTRIMLSPREEYLRTFDTTKRAYRKHLPPSVGGKVGEFFVCKSCHEEGTHAGSYAKAV